MRFAYQAADGIRRTILGTQVATDTKFRINGIGQQGLALFGAAGLVSDMFQIFVTEVVEGRQYRIRRRLSQSAECRVFYHPSEGGKRVQGFFRAPSFRYLVQQFQQAFVADTAWGTFTAGFFDGKVEIETGDGYHTVIFVHHDHASRSHHGTGCQQVVEVNGSIQMFLRQTAP